MIKTTHKKLKEMPAKYCRVVCVPEDRDTARLERDADGISKIIVGTGKTGQCTPYTAQLLIRSIVRAARMYHCSHLALSTTTVPVTSPHEPTWVARTIAENVLLAAYQFTRYKTTTPPNPLKEVRVCEVRTRTQRDAIAAGVRNAEGANLARDIANTPACDMTPAILGARARDALKGTAARVNVFGETTLRKLKMGLLLGVGQATTEETKLIVMSYPGQQKRRRDTQPLVLIGKGVTYDSGGLNVKPSGAMHDMHLDMSGGAAVIGAMRAIASRGLTQPVVGIIPAAENAISEKSMRAGDILTAMNGETVEVLHTDAEGRLILADALTYCARYNPCAVVDVATLTGAALVALGTRASALMTRDQTLRAAVTAASEQSGDRVWPLPLWEEYDTLIKSDRADVANIANNFSRYAGTIEGGVFLNHFAPAGVPFAHIDMAPRMESTPDDKLAKGATGEPVRLLVQLAEDYAQRATISA